MTRVAELLEKLDGVETFYKEETSHVPEEIYEMIRIERELLLELREAQGDNVSPFKFEGYEVPEALTKPY
jgi:hypothetical protein